MIRDILYDFQENGEKPDLKNKTEDPFWDPPTPTLIGQAYLPLHALGLVYETDADEVILSVDGT